MDKSVLMTIASLLLWAECFVNFAAGCRHMVENHAAKMIGGWLCALGYGWIAANLLRLS